MITKMATKVATNLFEKNASFLPADDYHEYIKSFFFLSPKACTKLKMPLATLPKGLIFCEKLLSISN